jgi:segregation and condensation protein B
MPNMALDDTTADPLAESRALAALLSGATWEVDDIIEDFPSRERERPGSDIVISPKEPEDLRPPLTVAQRAKEPEDLRPPLAQVMPEQILEAMLFVGGAPLTLEAISTVIRGFTAERVREVVDGLNRKYRVQNRPYTIEARETGFVMAVKPAFRAVRERLYGGPKETRLSQPLLDVLSLVAYRQPISKGEIDALRGADSVAHVRQLVRLGIIAVTQRGDNEKTAVGYGTTRRFLEIFQLTSLDELPRLGETNLA